ncbi:MAG: TIR domain-containing protein [Hyphomonadaceae bacterium]
MTIFIAHAESDQAAAEECRDHFRQHGHVVELETGARGFRHLQTGDVVVALWSRNAVFNTWRMMLEKRMLDAWADGRLVLVKLDHHFLPVGLRDLPYVDATFVAARATNGWRDAERAARRTRDEAFVERQRRIEAAENEAAKNEVQGDGSPPPGAPPRTDRRGPVNAADEVRGPATAPPARPVKRSRVVLGAAFLHLLAILGVAAGGFAVVYFKVPGALFIIIAAATATFLLPMWLFLRPRPQSASPASVGASSKAAPAPDATAEAGALFISYAHADNDQVQPVVKLVTEHGRKVWIDQGDLKAGDGWAGEIVRAIKSAQGVMIMCSKSAFESDHVKREVYLADRHRKPMTPVFIENAEPPEDFEYFFANVQWLELFRIPESGRAEAVIRALTPADAAVATPPLQGA